VTIDEHGDIRHETTVDLPIDEAFHRFANLDVIKPREHNMLAVDIEETVVEQRPGGDIYDRGIDGSICRWGRVLTFDPPSTFTFSWDIGPDWQVATNLAATSEVEVTFETQEERRTRVVLVHRHINRHGDGWESLREGLDSDAGWPLYLARLTLVEPGTSEGDHA
jgi:uncharacterized protein YndB with AHSA1/START domain